jgi:hypothetical protein
VVILAAQAYLILGPAGSAAAKQAGPTVPAGADQ